MERVSVHRPGHSSEVLRITPPNVITLASTSGRRREAIEMLFSEATLMVVSGGEEPKSTNVADIASGKVLHALQVSDHLKQGHLVVAADVIKRGSSTEGQTDHWKPSDPREELLGLFENIYNAHLAYPYVQPAFVIEVAGAVIGADMAEPDTETRISWVEMDREKAELLQTPQGIEEYLRVWRHINERVDPHPSAPETTSGALSLETLIAMGAVVAIDGKVKGNNRFEEAVRVALNRARTGLPGAVFEKFHPHPRRTLLHEIPSLNEVTKYVLQQAA